MVAVLAVDEFQSAESVAAEFRSVVASMSESCATEWLSAVELERDLVEGWAKQTSNLAWWLLRVAEFDRRELFTSLGVTSCAQWLTLRCGIATRTAREHVKVARQVAALPSVCAAFAEGRLSYSKVRAVCRVATPATEAFLLDLAFSLTTPQLERSIKAYEAAHRLNTRADDEARRAKCGAQKWIDHDGLAHYELVVEPLDSMLIDKGMEWGCDTIYEEQRRAAKEAADAAERLDGPFDGGAESAGAVSALGAAIAKAIYPKGPSGRLQGLLRAVERGLVNMERPEAVFAELYQIVIHVREGAAFTDDEGNVDLGNGLTVHPKTLQKIACKSMITAMLEGSDARPLDLGRSRRVATRKQKIALSALYPTCQFPGCEIGWQRCEFHHLDFWARDKGGTDLERMRPLCTTHHDLVHGGGWQLLLDHRARVMAVTPKGTIIAPVPHLTDTPVGPQLMIDDVLARGYDDSRQGARDRAETLMGASHGERLTRQGLSMLVEGLLRKLDGPEAVFDVRALWPRLDDDDDDDAIYVDGVRRGDDLDDDDDDAIYVNGVRIDVDLDDDDFEGSVGDTWDLEGRDPPAHG